MTQQDGIISNSYHSNNILFYCHLSPLEDNQLIISKYLVIIRGDNRVTIAIYHTFYCHLSPSYHILPITYDSMPITYYLLRSPISGSCPYTTNSICYRYLSLIVPLFFH